MIISDDNENMKNKGTSKDVPKTKSENLEAKHVEFDKSYEKNILLVLGMRIPWR